MPRGVDSDGNSMRGSRTAPQRRNAGEDSEFVQLELTVKEKEALRAFGATSDELDGYIKDFLDNGNKITLKWDDRNTCYVAFGFPGVDTVNGGYILTGRGGAPSRALRELVYKHAQILGGEWGNYHNRGGSGSGDDW